MPYTAWIEHFTVEQARRAWLEKKDVINTLPLAAFLKALRRKS